jgi:hypothetical protein
MGNITVASETSGLVISHLGTWLGYAKYSGRMESWTGHGAVTVVFTSTWFPGSKFKAILRLYRVTDKRFPTCKASAVVTISCACGSGTATLA